MARATSRRKGGKAAPAGKSAKAASPTTPAAVANTAVAGFEMGELRQLIRLVQRTGIGELELSSNGRSVRISATSAGAAGGLVPALAPGSAARTGSAPATGFAAPPPSEPVTTHKPITSPMVGTFYRSPAPDAEPFVEVGDVVEVGQTVCIIEAMKLMNEIESELKGRVVQILVENAQAVEFGQKLFLLEPI